MKNLRGLVIGTILGLGFTTACVGASIDKNWMLYSGAVVIAGGALVGATLEQRAIRNKEEYDIEIHFKEKYFYKNNQKS